MFQKLINRNVDYLYKLQINETEHQHHRLSWILAAQSIMFAGISVLLSDGSYKMPDEVKIIVGALISLIVAIGVSISISGIYSMLVGELCVGTILERWDEYDCKQDSEKKKEIPHQVILSPGTVMRSRLKVLLLYSFAPKVFCAGWMALLLFYVTERNCNWVQEHYIVTITGYYFVALIAICLVTAWAGKFFLYHWFYHDTKEKRMEKKCNDRHCGQERADDDAPRCDGPVAYNGNAYAQCQLNYINGHCCRCECAPVTGNRKESGVGEKRVTPADANLRIYHIVVDRFNGNWTKPPKNTNDFLGGNIRGIIDRLDYVAAQGYNAILLTPVFHSAAYHGYHTIDYTQMDSHFGTWQDFQELIDKAHARNIKIICDFVPNHCHVSNRWFVEAKNDKRCGPYRNRFYFDESRKGGYVSYQNIPDLPKLNLYDNAMADRMVHVAMDLAKRGIDGLRIDHAIGVPFRFLRNLNAALKEINPDLLVFGEVWAPHTPNDISQVEFKSNTRKEEVIDNARDLQENIQLDYVGVLDGVLDFEYRNIILDEIGRGHRLFGNNELKRRLDAHFRRYPAHYRLLLFLDNHDTNRILFECGNDRALMDEAIEYTRSLPYPSIIYYGTERYMSHDKDIHDGTPYADLDVREPMDWR